MFLKEEEHIFCPKTKCQFVTEFERIEWKAKLEKTENRASCRKFEETEIYLIINT